MQARAVVEPRGEPGVEPGELVEHCGIKLEHGAVADRRHRRQARAALHRADFPEDVARAQEADVAPRRPLPGVLDEPAGLHDPPQIALVALARDDVAGFELHLAAALDDELDALGIKLPERFVGAEKRSQPLGLCLLPEPRGRLRIGANESERDGPVQPQRAHGARGCAERDARGVAVH